MNRLSLPVAVVCMLAANGCGPSTTNGNPDTGTSQDSSTLVDSASGSDARADAVAADGIVADVPVVVGDGGFVALDPCPTAALYASDPTGANNVDIGPGFQFTPTCIRIPAGDQVTFRGDFATHPLRASTRGTTNNPIPSLGPTTPPATQLVVFPTAGFYPFYCDVHGADDGTGMSGVVWVQ